MLVSAYINARIHKVSATRFPEMAVSGNTDEDSQRKRLGFKTPLDCYYES
jgi:hypothetical protein